MLYNSNSSSSINPISKCPAFIINKTIQKYPIRSQSMGRRLYFNKNSNLTHIIKKKYSESICKKAQHDIQHIFDNQNENNNHKNFSMRSFSGIFQGSDNHNNYPNKKSIIKINEDDSKVISSDCQDKPSLPTTLHTNKEDNNTYIKALLNYKGQSLSDIHVPIKRGMNNIKNFIVSHNDHEAIEKNVEMLIYGSISQNLLDDLYENYKKMKLYQDVKKVKMEQKDKENVIQGLRDLHSKRINEDIDDNILTHMINKSQINVNSILKLNNDMLPTFLTTHDHKLTEDEHFNKITTTMEEMDFDNGHVPNPPFTSLYKEKSRQNSKKPNKIEENQDLESFKVPHENIKNNAGKMKTQEENENGIDKPIKSKLFKYSGKEIQDNSKSLTGKKESKFMNFTDENFFMTSPKLTRRALQTSKSSQTRNIHPFEEQMNQFKILSHKPSIQKRIMSQNVSTNNPTHQRRGSGNSLNSFFDQSNTSNLHVKDLKELQYSVNNIVTKCTEYANETSRNYDFMCMEIKELEDKIKQDYDAIEEKGQKTIKFSKAKEIDQAFRLKREFKKKLVKKLLDSIKNKKQILYAIKTEFLSHTTAYQGPEKITLADIIDRKCQNNLGF